VYGGYPSDSQASRCMSVNRSGVSWRPRANEGVDVCAISISVLLYLEDYS